jgi:putative membrane protein
MRWFRFSLGICLGTLLAATASLATDSDPDFARKAAEDGMLEVELGKLAALRAEHPKVREFGKKMSAEHQQANDALKAAANQSGITVPAQPGAEQQAMIDRLSKLSGAEFDAAYMQEMVAGHEKVAESLRAQAANPDSEVGRWAANTLPKVEAHLRHARSLAQEIGAGSMPAVSAAPPEGEPDEGQTEEAE